MTEATIAERFSDHAAAIDSLKRDNRDLHQGYGKVLGAVSELRGDVRDLARSVERLEEALHVTERPSGTLIIQPAAPRSERPGIKGALLDKVIIAGLCSGFWVIAELVKLALAHH